MIQGTATNVRRAANLIRHQTLKQIKLWHAASRASADRFDEVVKDEAAGHSKSLLVNGEYRFDDCVHHDSYHEDGCFSKLVDDDVLVFDVGTHWITCSHLHYFESAFDVDYVRDVTYEGVDLTDGTPKRIQQTCGEYESMFYSWNKPKLQRLLLRNGALSKYDLNGLLLCFFTLGDVERLLGEKLEENPYYLVTV